MWRGSLGTGPEMVVIARQFVVVIDVTVEILPAVEDPVRLAKEDIVALVEHELLNALGRGFATGSVVRNRELSDELVRLVALEFRVVIRAAGLREPTQVIEGIIDPGDPLV